MSLVRAAIPDILYGTAWKKDKTQHFVEQAIRAGFRGVDTACQPKHYYEPGVGNAMENLISDGVIKREDIFLQTKFTPFGGQDPKNIPYDPRLPLEDQVSTSFQTSLRNLKTEYLDSLVLHSPLKTVEETLTVWRAFEDIHRQGRVRYLGLSNTYSLPMLRAVYDAATIKPSFVQNRFYADSGYDIELRAFCRAHEIRYQSFWTLTANPRILGSDLLRILSSTHRVTPAQLFFRFLQQHEGILPLSGTTSEQHMVEDVAVKDTIQLSEQECEAIAHELYHA